ncbi:hypothetical protein Ocin01_09728 [Orchesella cincta]|uniref:Uncharacterized protein n=1 Tax=Orchesella cincta TaxID=48709 RepID=A0A1D2MVB5_ORCCI|nr:hypothetical protein Ocin01_09728 [Orchesella cincta]
MKGLHFLLVAFYLALFVCLVFGQDSDNNGDSGQPPKKERFLLPGWLPWKPINIPRPVAAATTGGTTGGSTGGSTGSTMSTMMG